jgi:hypothetical protein
MLLVLRLPNRIDTDRLLFVVYSFANSQVQEECLDSAVHSNRKPEKSWFACPRLPNHIGFIPLAAEIHDISRYPSMNHFGERRNCGAG